MARGRGQGRELSDRRCTRQAPPQPAGGDDDVGLGSEQEEIWCHLCLQYESPWRPTYLLLARNEKEENLDGIVHLTVLDGSLGPGHVPTPVWLTMWELLAKLGAERVVTLTWHKLQCRSNKAVHQVQPWLLQAEELLSPTKAFWAGLEAEQADRRAKQRRARRARRPANRQPLAAAAEAALQALEDAASAPAEPHAPGAEEDPALAVEDWLAASGEEDALEEAGEQTGAEDVEDESHNPFGVPQDVVLPPPPPPPLVAERAEPMAQDGGPPVSASSTTSDSSSTTSDSSSSTSSDSSGSSAPVARRQNLNELVVPTLDGAGEGKIKYTNIGDRQEFYAICPMKECHGKCILTRTAKAGPKPGQGRPLGFLAAWLRLCSEGQHPTRTQHLKFRPTYEERLAARRSLADQPAAPFFFEKERAQADDEGLEPARTS